MTLLLAVACIAPLFAQLGRIKDPDVEVLRSFTPQQMKSYAIQTKSLMPSQSKLSAKDVADIVIHPEELKGSGN